MLKKIIPQFNIESIGFPHDRRFSKEFAYAGESHNFTEMVYVDSGKIEVVENENVYLLGSGNIIFHAPMEFHTFKSAEDTSPRMFNLSAVIQGNPPENLYKGVFYLDMDDRAAFMEIFSAAKEFMKEDNGDRYIGQEAAENLSAFIMRICKENNLNNNISSEAGALVYRKIVKTMNEELYSNLSLEELAGKNHISVSYLKVLFYRYAGTSPKSYYANLRAHEAARLVLSGVPKAIIAEKMGFSSPNYFTVFFRKHMGVTPMEYQKGNG